MLPYNKALKPLSRSLRSALTQAEQRLWERVRRKQIAGVQFYRQKPLAGYIVDFYCASANLVIELDGSQHMEADAQAYDLHRTQVLEGLGLKVLRFNNKQVIEEMETVMMVVLDAVKSRSGDHDGD